MCMELSEKSHTDCKGKGETDMFMKIKEYYSHCYLCKGKYLIEVFGDTTAKVKRIHKCKCES